MAMIKCKACGSEMSKKASACPKCGHPNKEANYLSGGQVLLGLLFAGGVIWWLASGGFGSNVGGTASAPDPEELALQHMELTHLSWSKGGFDTVMLLNATIENHGSRIVKDIRIECDGVANSGTKIDAESKVLYETIRPGHSKRIKDFSMGFVNSQVSKARCKLTHLTVL